MSSPASTDSHQALCNEVGRIAKLSGDQKLPGALVFLLQSDPQALIEVELVDHPLDLPQEQFEALLIDSECEV